MMRFLRTANLETATLFAPQLPKTAKPAELKHPVLEPFKTRLLSRRIKSFDESNWWTWGRLHYQSSEKRLYVNCKTRNPHPFFLHPCNDYDRSVLAIFPKQQEANLNTLCTLLNEVDWQELGFICDGRFLFSQRALEQCFLPEVFREYAAHSPLFEHQGKASYFSHASFERSL